MRDGFVKVAAGTPDIKVADCIYNREQIAYLLFIAIAKSVLSLEDIQLLIYVQKATYTGKTAYEYFANEIEMDSYEAEYFGLNAELLDDYK